jgi:hypothetical protein
MQLSEKASQTSPVEWDKRADGKRLIPLTRDAVGVFRSGEPIGRLISVEKSRVFNNRFSQF